ncbi:MAG TPA: glycerophosphodiester phosphodiesterase [Polyangia bacterium]
MSHDAADAGAERWARRDRGRPLIIGHRGASAREVENTVPAFVQAAAEGADGVELDVFLSASGEVVVFHDDDLQRLAGLPHQVRTMSLHALRAVALPRGARIPTLDEVFEACGPSLLVNVEIKSTGATDVSLPALVAGVSEVVDRRGAAARVLVSSFDPRAVALWQERRTDVPAALVFEDGVAPVLGKALALPFLKPKAVHPEAVLCRPDVVAAWHAAGYMVNTWTVDDPNRIRELAMAGVDGIITNDPAGALRAFA